MGYYLAYGLIVYAILLIGFYSLRKFKKKNFYFLFSALYLYFLLTLYSVFKFVWCYHNAHSIFTIMALYINDIKIVELKGSEPYRTKGKRTLCLINHRSMLDFNIHDAFCLGQASYLSSERVAYYLPLTWISTRFVNSVFFFKRGGRGDNLEEFFKWLDSNFEWFMTRRKSLIFYGEGHRNQKKHPLPLKRGMIRYGYSRNIPIQITMAFGLQNSMNEKELRVEGGKTIYFYRTPLILPSQFKSEEAFHERVQSVFNEKFYQIQLICDKKSAQLSASSL